MRIYKKHKKRERINFYIEEDLKQHLYEAAYHAGKTASQIMREAIRKELNKTYKQYKPKEQ